jgi:hypothetical protein
MKTHLAIPDMLSRTGCFATWASPASIRLQADPAPGVRARLQRHWSGGLMRRTLALFAAVATLLFAAPLAGNAEPVDPAARQAMTSVQYLVGNWNCAHTVGSFSGTYTTSFTNALNNLWLKQRYDFPATQTEPAWFGEFYLGYDARVTHWVRFGAMSTGQYFGMASKDASITTMAWAYRFPGTGASAVWTKKSDSEFTIDGPSYPENGTTVTEHHICKKSR